MISRRDCKLVTATLTVVGIIMTAIGKAFGPIPIHEEYSRWYGNFADKAGWFLLLIVPLIYIALDWENLFPKKQENKESCEDDPE